MGKLKLGRLFDKDKQNKEKSADELTVILLPSVMGIILCSVLLVGATSAWFNASQQIPTQSIQSANYSAYVLVDNKEAVGKIPLAVGKHTVSITANGTATTGYFAVEFGGKKLHTVQVPKGGTITFTLEINEATMLDITAEWGTSAKAEKEKINAGNTIVYGTPVAPTCTCEIKCEKPSEVCEVCKSDITLCKSTKVPEAENTTSAENDKVPGGQSSEGTGQTAESNVPAEDETAASPEKTEDSGEQENTESEGYQSALAAKMAELGYGDKKEE